MDFKSKKDIFFSGIVIAILVLVSTIGLFSIAKAPQDKALYFALIAIAGVFILIVWIFFGTKYELNDQFLYYKCGPFGGKIALASINEIIVGKTLWVGLKPATARKGLLIKYNKYDEIYISPRTNESFVKSILSLKSDIKVSK
jgi:membrane protease YdiL (CAAX protease family)